ncbi:MAG TPA: hypothetical protein VJL60_00560 [Gammaproteobacteria bacterium]|nr:hypothetical protein [Gammaproteobacteria bacterium]
MNLKNIKSNRNPLGLIYKENSAINGHSVDRFNYAVQLTHTFTDEALIKAHAWFSLASDEADMQELASLYKHQVAFELKKRGIFSNAQALESEYRLQYSSEAMLEKLRKSKNPLNMVVLLVFKMIQYMVDVIDFLDAKIIHGRGNSFFWGCISVFFSLSSLLLLTTGEKIKFGSLLIMVSIVCSIFSAGMSDQRSDE